MERNSATAWLMEIPASVRFFIQRKIATSRSEYRR